MQPSPLDVADRPVAGASAAQVINAVKVYGKGDTAVTALAGITASFAAGAFTAIMGPSGSGKSTLMHCVAGLDRLTSGTALIGDVDLSRLNDRDLTVLRRDRVGFVFQAYNLVPTLTALENITLPIDLAGRKPDQAWLDSVVQTLGIGDRLAHKPTELSGGQQQRVAVARALASRPAIIFADEPTGNLDSKTGKEILAEFRRLNHEHGQTIILVTHDPTIAAVAPRVITVKDGLIESDIHHEAPAHAAGGGADEPPSDHGAPHTGNGHPTANGAAKWVPTVVR
ncbi:MAG TPA: ABC transporter ATP-binding protein [Gemmataceae bacterium]|nr:ABC transporter ATP-binding protein [Gemmataceae bacterium]